MTDSSKKSGPGECHAHIILDGINYREAVKRHQAGPDVSIIRKHLQCYQQRNITFVRDGGDALGVSARAKQLAEEYGIDYRTPLFALHKKGHYGGIVGYAYSDEKEYCSFVKKAAAEGADFIKLMLSGILDFERGAQITGQPLTPEEIREKIHIAHEEGFSVMAHVNGAETILAAIEAGCDSVEHGNWMNEECLDALAEHHTIWVPTFVTLANLQGKGRFDEAVIDAAVKRHADHIRKGFQKGVLIAAGSDAGAWNVFHGSGICEERENLRKLDESSQTDEKLQKAEQEIIVRFRRK